VAELASYFTGLLSTGLKLQETLLQEGRHPQSANQVYQELRQQLEAARAAALQAGKRNQDVDEAAFAVVAWLDEIMAPYPNWLAGITPLQKTLFNTYNAGNEFFTHLNQLTPQQDEVREVYYLVLCLGFIGQYYYESGEGGELGRLKDLHSRQLPHPPTPLHTLPQEHITPQPYLSPDPGPARVPRHWDELVLKSTFVVAVLLPLAFLIYYLWGRHPEAPPQPALRQRQDLEQLIATFHCAQIDPLFKDNDSRVTLRGYVPKPEEATRLQQEAEKFPGIQQVTSEVQIRVWPYCEVVELLAQDQRRNHDRQYGLTVTPMAAHSSRFVEGENLIVSLLGPTYDAYLYVDLYQLDGMVTHILPNPITSNNLWKTNASSPIVLGQPLPGQHVWRTYTIQPPFGQEMVVAMASPTPLFAGLRPEQEKAGDYLKALRQVLETAKNRDQVAVEYLFTQTEPRKP